MPKSPAEAVSLPDRTRLRWTRTEARGVMAAYEASGLSIEKFSEREGLKPARVARWMRKLKIGKSSAAPKFVELQPARSSANQVEIVLRTGHILFVNESFDPRSLRRVLELLELDAEC